jgi:hypothetical protein
MNADYLNESVADEPLIGFVEGPKHAVPKANRAPNPTSMRMVFFMGWFCIKFKTFARDTPHRLRQRVFKKPRVVFQHHAVHRSAFR